MARGCEKIYDLVVGCEDLIKLFANVGYRY